MSSTQLSNAFENLLITILKNTDKANRVLILEQYTQRYGGLSNKAGEEVMKLIREGEQE